jgi:ribosome biogenesis GTPase
VRNSSPVSAGEETPFEASSPADGAHEGIVLKAIAGQYVVQADSDKDSRPRQLQCTLRGNLKKNFTYSTSGSMPKRVQRAKRPFVKDTVAIGDRVRFTPSDDKTGVIEEILPRRTRFARSSFRGSEQTLITNLDQLVIVFACTEPNPDLWRIDRWLVAAESNGLDPLIVANKRDLVDEATFREQFAEFTRIGYRVLGTSARQPLGVEELRAALRGRISVFTGPSGVGKSSLLNEIQPGLNLDTRDIGGSTHKGRHTTTVRELIPLDSGGWVADTPGLRQLELLRLTRDELVECFVEFRPYLETPCRFRDCRHENEPGCKIKAAVEAGEISPRRYESFLILAPD